ncbi:MAG TPA: carbohydrate-binding protein [Peptococcaceae bacterium]|nr:carbohydrate-binding protein [Peptococcaceae bacterium]
MRRRRTSLTKEPAKKMRSLSELPGGVMVTPVPVTLGEDVTIRYSGLLAEVGAEQIYLHMGYGDANEWKYITDIPLQKNNGNWETTFEVKDDSRLNFCFRDSAYNWDNNGGLNWSLEVHSGKTI